MSNEIESNEIPATQSVRATRKRGLLLVGGAFALIAIAYGMSPQQSYDSLDRMLDQQAFMLSANDGF